MDFGCVGVCCEGWGGDERGGGIMNGGNVKGGGKNGGGEEDFSCGLGGNIGKGKGKEFGGGNLFFGC